MKIVNRLLCENVNPTLVWPNNRKDRRTDRPTKLLLMRTQKHWGVCRNFERSKISLQKKKEKILQNKNNKIIAYYEFEWRKQEIELARFMRQKRGEAVRARVKVGNRGGCGRREEQPRASASVVEDELQSGESLTELEEFPLRLAGGRRWV